MKFLLLFIICIFFFLLDISVIPLFTINGSYTSLTSVYFFICCMNIEKYEIVYFSVVIGFLQDVFFINGFGVNIFLNIILGVLFYYVSIKYNKNKYFLSVLIVSIFCIFKSFITNIFLMIFLGVGISGLYMIYELIYIFVFSAFLYLFLGRIFKGRLFKKSLEF